MMHILAAFSRMALTECACSCGSIDVRALSENNRTCLSDC